MLLYPIQTTAFTHRPFERPFGILPEHTKTLLIHVVLCTLSSKCHCTEFWRNFYGPDVLPVSQPTVSKHWRRRFIAFHHQV